MSAVEGGELITEAEVSSFADKLAAWGNDLPPKEHALLKLLLAQASGAAPDDVQGYVLGGIAVGPSAIKLLSPFADGSIRFQTLGASHLINGTLGSRGGPNLINGTLGGRP